MNTNNIKTGLIKIPGALTSTGGDGNGLVGGVVAYTGDIYDVSKSKNQAAINSEISSAIDDIQSNLFSGDYDDLKNKPDVIEKADEGGYATKYSDAEGDGAFSHGWSTNAVGDLSHAEGNNTHAVGDLSHAEGVSSTANGEYSHAEGCDSIAIGEASHAEGYHSRAIADYSHAGGNNVTTNYQFQTVVGQYNKPYEYSSNGYFAVGCGTGVGMDGNKNSLEVIGNYVYIDGVGGYVGTRSSKPTSQQSLNHVVSHLDTKTTSLLNTINSSSTAWSNLAPATNVTLAAITGLDATNAQDAFSEINTVIAPLRTGSMSSTLVSDTNFNTTLDRINLSVPYDISAVNLSEEYTDLEDALGSNGSNIPQNLRVGGLTVKFVNSSTNKYEQWGLKSSSWSINTSDWALEVDGSFTGAKLKLPFELEKPSANEYVTQSSEIGHREKTVEEELDDFGEKVGNTEEDGYYLCDAQGNVVMKFTDKGLDAAKISQRLKRAELSQSNTEEEGAYITDANGNYIFIANSSGINMKVSPSLLNYLKSKIEGGGGGTSYDNIGYPILDDTNPLAMLIRGRSRARLFKTWGVVGASFETGLIECYNDGTATTMTDAGNDWPTLFGEMNSVDVGNYAIAGSTLRNWLSSANGWTKLNNDTAKQAYLVNMSSNDNDTSKYNEPIGDITADIDYNNWQNNAATWVGCLATIIQRIREKSPRCYIFLATRRNASGAKSNARANQMCQALRQVCTCFPNVYLVDMWEYGANWDDTNFKKEFRCGGHPNRNGHIYLADAFNTYFDWIIRNNPIGMRNAAFIGTDYQDKDNY